MNSEHFRKLQVHSVFVGIPIIVFGLWIGIQMLAGDALRTAAWHTIKEFNPFILMFYGFFWWKALRQPKRWWNNGLYAIVFAELTKFYDRGR